MFNAIKEEAQKHGLLIIIEGGDGVGKTSTASALVKHLLYEGIPAKYVRNPGSDEVAEKIRDITKQYKMGWFSSACLFSAALKHSLDYNIVPNLQNKKIIVIDRFVRSTYIYQTFYKAFPNEYTNDFFKRKCFFKDITDHIIWDSIAGKAKYYEFVLTCPTDIAWDRVHSREKTEKVDVWESQSREYFDEIHEVYEESSRTQLPYCGMDQCTVIDSSELTPAGVAGEIMFRLEEKLANPRGE